MCNKQNYSFKKVYILTLIITVVSFIVFFHIQFLMVAL